MNAEQPYRVLLIEDCTRGMSPTFSQFAYSGNPLIRMNLAANLFDAAHRLEKNAYSLILLSLRLPDCQGTETFARLRKLTADTPVAILLQHDEWHLEAEVRAAGARGVYSPGQVNVEEALTICRSLPEIPKSESVDNNNVNSEEPANAVAVPEKETPDEEDAAVPAVDAPATNTPYPADTADELIIPTDDGENPATADELTVNNLEDVRSLELDVSEAINEAVPPAAPEPENISEAPEENTGEPDSAEMTADSADTPQAETAPKPRTEAPAADAGLAETPAEEVAAEAVAEAGTPDAPLTAEALLIPTPEAERTAYREELVRLRMELKQHRAVRQELEGVSKALEERCRELEAGQAALIEAEHVAIEREKAARLAAEARLAEMTEQFNALREVENRSRRLSTELDEARADDSQNRQLTDENSRLRLELENTKEQLHEQRDVVEHSGQTIAYLRSKVNDLRQRAETAEGEFNKLTLRFKKLQKTYHKICGEKKNLERRTEELELENRTILQKTGTLKEMYEKAQCERLRNLL